MCTHFALKIRRTKRWKYLHQQSPVLSTLVNPPCKQTNLPFISSSLRVGWLSGGPGAFGGPSLWEGAIKLRQTSTTPSWGMWGVPCTSVTRRPNQNQTSWTSYSMLEVITNPWDAWCTVPVVFSAIGVVLVWMVVPCSWIRWIRRTRWCWIFSIAGKMSAFPARQIVCCMPLDLNHSLWLRLSQISSHYVVKIALITIQLIRTEPHWLFLPVSKQIF